MIAPFDRWSRYRRIVSAVVLIAALGAVVGLTLPRSEVVLVQDDIDFARELLRLPFVEYVMTTTRPAAQFIPVFKAVYGAGMLATDFRTLPLQIFSFLVRMTTLALFLVLLRRLNVFTLAGALVCGAFTVSSIGITGVFFWPIQGQQEMSICLLALALLLMVRYYASDQALNLLGACVALVLGAFSWGGGFVFPAAIAVAATIVVLTGSRARRHVLAMAAMWIATGLGLAGYFLLAEHDVTGSALSGALAHWTTVTRSFFYGGVVNGALSGMFPRLLSGVLHVTYFVVTAIGCWIVIHRTRRPELKLVAAAVFFAQIGVFAVIALTRWRFGFIQATSARYIYTNVPLQLFLTALLIGAIAKRFRHRSPVRLAFAVGGVAFFALSAAVGLEARRAQLESEREREYCTEQIIRAPNEYPCLAAIYEPGKPEFVRDVLVSIERNRAR